MFAFFFKPETPSLSQPSFYRSIHHQLGPLQKPFLSSTSPADVAQRISVSDDSPANKKSGPAQSQPLYDIVYNSSSHTVHSSLPNIPDPGSSTMTGFKPGHIPQWTRVEAMNAHSQLLSTYIDTRLHPSEVERTCKTSRGWWVVWIRLPSQERKTNQDEPPHHQKVHGAPSEAFLVRKASDHTPPSHVRNSSGTRFFRDIAGGLGISQAGAGTPPGRLTEGVGLDARRYVEGLLSLSR